MTENKQPEQMQPESQGQTTFSWAKVKDGTPEIYCNYFNVGWTLFDVRFVLGQLVPITPDSKTFEAEQRAAVTIAWPDVKVLRDALIALVQRYEEANGEIKPIKLPLATPGSVSSVLTEINK